ncbi:MAG TPA: hypothetical protein VHG08_02230 [Longimicrobium sp.]|nr:hypothetical protein [Longimicrobium sp.]
MLNRIRAVTRRRLAAALATALLGASLAAPASAPAAKLGCDPNTEECSTNYIFYSSPTKVEIVGTGTLDCNGSYSTTSGYATPYFDEHYMHCPY